MPSSQFDDPEEDTQVEPGIIEDLPSDEVTREHDGGEWLAGFAKGVEAGRRDVLQAVGRVLGPGAFADEFMLKVIEELEPKK